MANRLVLPRNHEVDTQALDLNDMASLSAYKDMAFGWKLADAMARRHLPCPGIIEGDDEIIFRAYLQRCNPKYKDTGVTGALAISLGLPHVRSTLEGMLLAEDATVEKVAAMMHLDDLVVLAYEKLFFNILDRKADAHFIAQVVYPSGRLEEYIPNYHQKADLSTQVKRIGYNRGMVYVAELAGYRVGLLRNLTGPDAAARLEADIMANALFLASTGWLNQNSSGLHAARTLLAAAKQAGQEQQTPSSFASLGKSLLAEMTQIHTERAEAAAVFKAGRARN